jgi:hypothetical protein
MPIRSLAGLAIPRLERIGRGRLTANARPRPQPSSPADVMTRLINP